MSKHHKVRLDEQTRQALRNASDPETVALREAWENYQVQRCLYRLAVIHFGQPGCVAATWWDGRAMAESFEDGVIALPLRGNWLEYFADFGEFAKAAAKCGTFRPALPAPPDFVPAISDGQLVVVKNEFASCGIQARVKDDRVLYVPRKGKVTWTPDNLWYRSRLCGLNGSPISVGWPKFMNSWEVDGANERIMAAAEAGQDVYAVEKLDGSLVIRGVNMGNVIIRTRGSHELGGPEDSDDFDSDNAREIAELAESMGLMDPRVCPRENVCLLFEYVSPSNKLVVEYAEPRLVLIGAVDFIGETMFRPWEALEMAGSPDWPTARYIRVDGGGDIQCIVEDEFVGEEGAVIWLGRELFKVKTEDYLRAFRARYFLSARRAMTAALELRLWDDPRELAAQLSAPEELVEGLAKHTESLKESARELLREFGPARQFAIESPLQGGEFAAESKRLFGKNAPVCFGQRNGKIYGVMANMLCKQLNLRTDGQSPALPGAAAMIEAMDQSSPSSYSVL